MGHGGPPRRTLAALRSITATVARLRSSVPASLEHSRIYHCDGRSTKVHKTPGPGQLRRQSLEIYAATNGLTMFLGYKSRLSSLPFTTSESFEGLSNTSYLYELVQPMRFLFLAVVVTLTASMSVSATPTVFNQDSSQCRGSDELCFDDSQCCDYCYVDADGFGACT
ncbi:hypothetical protein DFH29DRAFT_370191 [Suillus ampliporus]|nr:hypothetical protein DFH29DRAFT_370191 [Suillus ampliporus]